MAVFEALQQPESLHLAARALLAVALVEVDHEEVEALLGFLYFSPFLVALLLLLALAVAVGLGLLLGVLLGFALLHYMSRYLYV